MYGPNDCYPSQCNQLEAIMAHPAQASPPRQTTKILTWNANGLLARKTELIQFMNAEKLDIVMITESHLTHAGIRNYKLYTCNHPSEAAHGAALYARYILSHHEIEIRLHCTEPIQAAGIAVRHHRGTEHVIVSVYSPPKHKITSCQ